MASKVINASEAVSCVTEHGEMDETGSRSYYNSGVQGLKEPLSEECTTLPMTAGNNTNLQDQRGPQVWLKVWACHKCRLWVFY